MIFHYRMFSHLKCLDERRILVSQLPLKVPDQESLIAHIAVTRGQLVRLHQGMLKEIGSKLNMIPRYKTIILAKNSFNPFQLTHNAIVTK